MSLVQCILFIIVLHNNCLFSIVVQSKSCERLWPNENVNLTCTPPNVVTAQESNQTNFNDCSNDDQPIGTIANYECNDYYIPIDSFMHQEVLIVKKNQLKCEKSGAWSSLVHFNGFQCAEDCGRRNLNRKPLIINGNVTDQAEWPWHVSLYRKGPEKANGKRNNFSNYLFICGGSLVRASIVLTAAHCVTDAIGSRITLQPSKLLIVLGLQTQPSSNLDKLPADVQIARVKNIFIHDGYDPTKEFQADISLIQLEEAVQFNDKVSAVCLPNDDVIELESISPGMFGDVVGFGKDETGHYSNTLKSGRLRVKSRDECFNSLQVRLSESKICAGTLQDSGKWTSVCNGDSGGGFVFPSPLMEKYYVNGIVSFGNRPNENGTECQNNAIFTRVHSYFQWIRNVANKIHGSIIQELLVNELTPYVRKGNDKVRNGRLQFQPINRALESRITSLELYHLKLNSLRLVETLTQAKHVQVINLTDISLDSKFDGRVHLPYLKTFVMDVAVTEYEGRESENIFSPTSNKQHLTDKTRSDCLKSMLFFNKHYDQELNLVNIAQLGINVQLTLKTIKVLVINRDEGRITLTSIPETNEILGNIPLEHEFQLRHLGIGGCPKLNLTEIVKRGRLLGMTSISLYYVEEFSSGHELQDLLQMTPYLKSLVIVMSTIVDYTVDGANARKRTIYISQVPRTLTHLSLTRVEVKYAESSLDEYRITFPGKSSVKKNLTNFSCTDCKFSQKALQEFSCTFPNLKNLHLFLLQTEGLNLTGILNGLHELEYVYIASLRIGRTIGISYPGVSQYFGSHHNFNVNAAAFSKTSNGSWLFVPNSDTEQYYIDLEFRSSYISEFYSALTGVKYRLEPFEVTAVRTGIYTFNGTEGIGSKNTQLRETFPDPSLLIQYINVLKVNYTQLNPKSFMQVMWKLQKSQVLQELHLRNMALEGVFQDKVILSPNLSTFRLHIDTHLNILNLNFVDGFMFTRTQFELLIPFQLSSYLFPFNNNYNNKESHQIIQDFELAYADAFIAYSYNKRSQGMIISHVDFVDDILLGLRNSTKHNDAPPLEKLNICYSLFNSTNIPVELNSLHLEATTFTPYIEITNRLHNLTQLSIIRPFIQDEQNQTIHRGSYTKLDLVAIHSSKIERLGLGRLYLTAGHNNNNNNNNSVFIYTDPSRPPSQLATPKLNLSILPQFTSLQLLAIHSIWLDSRLGEEFFNIFPAPKLALLAERAGSNFAHEVILLHALKNERLNWILFNAPPDWSELKVWQTTGVDSNDYAKQHRLYHLGEIKSILGNSIFEQLGFRKSYSDDKEIYRDIFEVERSVNGSWVLVRDKEKYLQDKLKVLGPDGLLRGCDINDLIDYKF